LRATFPTTYLTLEFLHHRAWSLCTGNLPHFSRNTNLVTKPGILRPIESASWIPYTDDGEVLKITLELIIVFANKLSEADRWNRTVSNLQTFAVSTKPSASSQKSFIILSILSTVQVLVSQVRRFLKRTVNISTGLIPSLMLFASDTISHLLCCSHSKLPCVKRTILIPFLNSTVFITTLQSFYSSDHSSNTPSSDQTFAQKKYAIKLAEPSLQLSNLIQTSTASDVRHHSCLIWSFPQPSFTLLLFKTTNPISLAKPSYLRV
jgi:hypothetical protein